MNDISISKNIEQKSAVLDKNIQTDKKNVESDFLNKLHSVHNSIDENNEPVAVSDDPLLTEVIDDVTDGDMEDENAPLYSDVMLAQINFSKKADVSVTKYNETAAGELGESVKSEKLVTDVTKLLLSDEGHSELPEDLAQTKSDTMLTRLTAEQKEQINGIDKTNNTAESTKNILTELLGKNSDTLTALEKKELYNQLKSYIQDMQPENEKLASFELTLSELEESVDIKVLRQVKEGTVQTSSRVTELFMQITSVFDQPQDIQNYEQAITDLQIHQSQNVIQLKETSVNPELVQTLNILKSDAAKLLQERVTAMLSINNKEAEIRLDPPEMGSMQIRIRSDAEQAQINFVVQNQQAKEALEQSLPRLREMLAQQGIELGESTISYGDPSGGDAQQNASQSQHNLTNNGLSDEGSGEANEHQIQRSQQQTTSSIDYYA